MESWYYGIKVYQKTGNVNSVVWEGLLSIQTHESKIWYRMWDQYLQGNLKQTLGNSQLMELTHCIFILFSIGELKHLTFILIVSSRNPPTPQPIPTPTPYTSPLVCILLRSEKPSYFVSFLVIFRIGRTPCKFWSYHNPYKLIKSESFLEIVHSQDTMFGKKPEFDKSSGRYASKRISWSTQAVLI